MRCLVLLGLLGCNEYELFNTAGYLREDYPRDADVLFVIDNSESMRIESLGLASSSGAFAARIAEIDASYGTEGLADAADRYIAEVTDRGRFVDFQLAITTMDVSADGGRLKGAPFYHRGDPDLAGSFEAALLCEATCFPSRADVPSDPSQVCGEPHSGEVTAEYLDCICGDTWIGNCGQDEEQGLEAVLLAMCRAVPEPPEACWERADAFGSEDVLTNEGLLNPGRTLIPILISDEGDASSRVSDYVAVPDTYVEAFNAFALPMSWGVVAPTLDDDSEVACPGMATSWGILRYDYLTSTTGGMRADIYGPTCGPADFDAVLARVGDLVSGRAAAFPLRGPADESTIAVFVEGEQIDPVPGGVNAFGVPNQGDGWSYRASDYTVILHGSAIPPVSARVEIFYKPE